MVEVETVPCLVCAARVSLPRLVSCGEDPHCARCGATPVHYLRCARCRLSFHPDLAACPQCGDAPSGAAVGSGLWALTDAMIQAAIAAAISGPQPASPPAPVPAPPVRHAAPPRARAAGQSTRAVYTSRSAARTPQLPPVVPRSPVEEDPASPPSEHQAAPPAGGESEAGMQALFATESSAQASASATVTAEYELITDQARLAEVIASLSEARVLAVDTETTGLDPFAEDTLLLVQVATPDRAYIVDARRVDARPLRRLFEDEKTLKLLQNAKFDYKMLRHQLGLTLHNIYDTMLAERLLTAGISRDIGLAALAKKYLQVVLDKAVRGSFIGAKGDFSPEQLRYAARDVLALFGIYEEQRKALQHERLLTTALLEFRTVVAVGEMELAGCLIDQAKWRTIIASATTERDRVAQELGDLLVEAGAVPQLTLFGGPAINLNSNAQLLECFRIMGLDLPDTMEATLLKYDHPAIKKLLEYRSFEKTISAFGEKFLELIHPSTGRIHPDFNQIGADTGRFSCTNPNVQQIPATSDFRSCFIAPPGYKLITCDYSQAELRILAQLSEDPAFVDAFCSGGDLHQLTASQMYQVPPDQVSKQMRGAAKVINFGLAYGRGPAALGTQLGVSTEEARALIDQYFRAYAGIGKWLDRAAREAVRKGYSSTMLGRKRYYPALDQEDPEYTRKRAGIERQGKNSPIQGANADMTKLALVALNEVLPDYHARIVNTVHDEIVVEAPEDQAEAVCSIVQREMVKAGEQIISLVPMVAEAKIADYWSK